MIQIRNVLNLEEKVAIVTGAATGLGLTAAQLISQAGAKVLINHLPGQEADAEQVSLDCPNDSLCYISGITEDEECRTMAACTIARHSSSSVMPLI